MSDRFFEQPILNSPYEYPAQHWELDESGQPTQKIIPQRRRSEYITPIPKARKRRGDEQIELAYDEGKGLSTEDQRYDPTPVINALRTEIEEEQLSREEREEAKKNQEAAWLWISGLETVGRKLGIRRVMDLSATPFFLRGSGYAEGTLFPWTMSDFSLMDAIECGIVKLPRVPVADNMPGGDVPKFRNLWEHIRTKMPKKGRGKTKNIDPLSIPAELKYPLDTIHN